MWFKYDGININIFTWIRGKSLEKNITVNAEMGRCYTRLASLLVILTDNTQAKWKSLFGDWIWTLWSFHINTILWDRSQKDEIINYFIFNKI